MLVIRYIVAFLILFPIWGQGCHAETGFPQVDFELNDRIYHLEIADTLERKTRGLMFRTELAKDSGMLFVYDKPAYLNIWMKNTLIPLTVLWLDERARIIDIKNLYPCRSQQCPSFGPSQPSQYVIELHASESAHFNLGDKLTRVTQWHAMQ